MKTLLVPCVYVAAIDLLGVMCIFLLPSRKKNIGGLSREEAEGFNGQRLEGPIPGKMNLHPVEKDGVPWMGKARDDCNSYQDWQIPWDGGGGGRMGYGGTTNART